MEANPFNQETIDRLVGSGDFVALCDEFPSFPRKVGDWRLKSIATSGPAGGGKIIALPLSARAQAIWEEGQIERIEMLSMTILPESVDSWHWARDYLQTHKEHRIEHGLEEVVVSTAAIIYAGKDPASVYRDWIMNGAMKSMREWVDEHPELLSDAEISVWRFSAAMEMVRYMLGIVPPVPH